jgi:hypothetical protein
MTDRVVKEILAKAELVAGQVELRDEREAQCLFKLHTVKTVDISILILLIGVRIE